MGQGVHALQDAVAHAGTDMAHHSTWQDIHPGKKTWEEATNVTEGAILVAEIMSGNSKHLSEGMSINISGMNNSQLEKLTTKLIAEMGEKGVKKINLTQTH